MPREKLDEIIAEMREANNNERNDVDHTVLGVGALLSYTLQNGFEALIKALFYLAP